MSHHAYLTCARYLQNNFPQAESLIIAPQNGWTPEQGGTLFRPDRNEIRPGHSLGRINIPEYNTPGYLCIKIGHNITSKSGTSQYISADVIVDMTQDPFSREDISALVTSLCKGMGGQFIPSQIGLYDVTALQMTGRENAMRNPWFHLKNISFCTQDITNLNSLHQVIVSGAFRFYLHNRLKFDYLPDAEAFRIRDIT